VFLGTVILGGLLSSAYWLGQTNAHHEAAPSPATNSPRNRANAPKSPAGTVPTIFPSDKSICKTSKSLPPVQWTQCDNLARSSGPAPADDDVPLVKLFMARRIQLANDFEQGQMNLAEFNVRFSQLENELYDTIKSEINSEDERRIRRLSALPRPMPYAPSQSTHCTGMTSGSLSTLDCY
jgi:hypothetical protein